MIGALLLHVLGELVFDSAQSMGRLYRDELTKYMEDQGLVATAERGDRPAR